MVWVGSVSAIGNDARERLGVARSEIELARRAWVCSWEIKSATGTETKSGSAKCAGEVGAALSFGHAMQRQGGTGPVALEVEGLKHTEHLGKENAARGHGSHAINVVVAKGCVDGRSFLRAVRGEIGGGDQAVMRGHIADQARGGFALIELVGAGDGEAIEGRGQSACWIRRSPAAQGVPSGFLKTATLSGKSAKRSPPVPRSSRRTSRSDDGREVRVASWALRERASVAEISKPSRRASSRGTNQLRPREFAERGPPGRARGRCRARPPHAARRGVWGGACRRGRDHIVAVAAAGAVSRKSKVRTRFEAAS